MPLQNRVDPFAVIHAVPQRGMFMGNRGGCFHDENKQLKQTRWKSRQWIVCVLDFKEWRRTLMSPNRYTELFFLDEATALAAGHRPCFECRRERAHAFTTALQRAGTIDAGTSVRTLDDAIAGEVQQRLKGKAEAPQGRAHDLPDGAMLARNGDAWIIAGNQCALWSFEGYSMLQPLPSDPVSILTPSVTLTAFSEGYRPAMHDSLLCQL